MEPMGERGRQGAAPLGGKDIAMVRMALSATALGSWAPEEQRPEQRVALDALSRIEATLEGHHICEQNMDAEIEKLKQVVEAAKRVSDALEDDTRDYEAEDFLREALGALDG